MRDIIIVGGGTAGSVLAERLTRSGRLRVMLIEAGGPPNSPFVSMPAAYSKLFKSKLDWAFESEPQQAVGGRRIFTPRGKMLGGSSNMNAMMHQWCHPADFDSWEALGAIGWSWSEVAPVFREQESWQGDGEDPGRGWNGPMLVESNRNASILSAFFVDAARRNGFGESEYYNGHAYEGAWLAELAVKNGKRFSAYHAYLKPAMQRRNLEVVTHAQVTRLSINDGRATGVTIRRGGSEQTYSAGAVVLSAGAYGSSHILMTSGIGPASLLRKFEIPVRLDAPEVGENLQDHPLLPVVYRTSSTDTIMSPIRSPLRMLRYLLFRRGIFASSGAEGFAFTQVRTGPVAAPDLEIAFGPLEVREQFLEPPRQRAFSLVSIVVAPRSRGRVTLRSKDPLVPPAIDPALLSDPNGVDASVLWKGVDLSRKIAGTPPLAEHNNGELRPGIAFNAERDLLDYASTELQTVYHPTSTCRMGSDEGAVVSPQLRVKGLDGLWVVDASVMPSVPRGHPNAVVAMIANRAAGWIEKALIAR